MTLVIGASQLTVIQPAVFNVKDFGAIGDNSHDDTSAIASAIAALRAVVNGVTGSMGGQTLYFPPGYYKISSTLDFTGLAEVRILGGSGRGGWGRLAADGNPPTVIAGYLPNSSTAATVDMANSTGCVWDGVSIVARGTAYAGHLLNFDATAASDVFGNRVQNCVLRGLFQTGGALLSLAGNIEFSADNVTFYDGGAGCSQVAGVNPSGAATWSNANSFRSCTFMGTRTNSILNPGPQWTLIDCTFEPTGTDPAPIAWTGLGNEDATALAVLGCGFWDNTGSTGSWLTSSVATSAFAFTGCKFGASSAAPIFSLSSHTGIAFNGCSFASTTGTGTPNIFDPAHTISSGVMNGCRVKSPMVDNHASVFV